MQRYILSNWLFIGQGNGFCKKVVWWSNGVYYLLAIVRDAYNKQFLNMKVGKTKYKYNKITQQKKFHLLTLVLQEKMLIKEAAKIVGINYSTAKTILFFNRNRSKSYQFQFQIAQQPNSFSRKLEASFIDLSIKVEDEVKTLSPFLYIDIISTIGSKNHILRDIDNNRSLLSKSASEENSFMNEEKKEISICNSNECANSGHQGNICCEHTRPMTRSQVALLKSKAICKSDEGQQKVGMTPFLENVENF